ncbi:MAG: hypothetical protein AAFY29_19505 [Pseudomonadota bacterium]
MRQNWQKGDILEIGLPHGGTSICQMLDQPEIAFFSPNDPSQVLFRLWVHKSTYCTGRWKKVGKSDIPPELAVDVPRFKQDPLDGSLSIYLSGEERPATEEECLGLERAAVWEANHVEDRIADHVQGKENKWETSLAFKPAT